MLLASVAFLALGQPLKPYTIVPGFKVSLPEAPQPLNLGAAMAKEIKTRMWYVRLMEGGYIITVAKSAGKEAKWPPERILANFVAGYVHSSRSEVLSRRSLTLNGWPGVELKAKSASGITSQNRVYVANGTVYQVSAASAPGSKGLPQAQAVLNSMSLPKR